jgi:hypothetical protein
MTLPTARSGPIRWISVGAFAAWLFLFAATYGYLPFLRHAWGMNLLRYLPDWIAWALTGLALLVTTDEARRGLIGAGRGSARVFGRLPQAARDGLLLAAAVTFFWVCRDRVLIGDSQLLSLFASRALPTEVLAVPGGVFLLFRVYWIAGALGLPGLLTAQLVACGLGALSLVCLAKAARWIAPEGRGAAAIPLLVFSGGVAAALAGRFETQPWAVAPISFYLWRSLRFLTERNVRDLHAAAAALGFAVLVQPVLVVLLPVLLGLPRLATSTNANTNNANTDESTNDVNTSADANAPRSSWPLLALLGLGPLLVYLVYVLVANRDPISAGTAIARSLVGFDGLVRFAGRTVGTDYVLLGVGHLKYLANAAFMLAGAPTAVLLALLVRDRGAWAGSTPVRFLGRSTALLGLTVLAVRPVWGPFDWDLFCVPAVFLACLAGAALAQVDDAGRRNHLLAAAVGLQLVFVGIPMLTVLQGAQRDPGPFGKARFEAFLLPNQTPPQKRIAPWL